MCQFVFVQTDKKSNTLVNLVLLICLFLVLSFLSKDNVPDIAVHFGKSLSLFLPLSFALCCKLVICNVSSNVIS